MAPSAERSWLPAILAAAAIGIGMVEGDYHWASEVIAGAIIGTVIGYTTGKNFRAEYERRKSGSADEKTEQKKTLAFSFAPTASNGRYGAIATWSW